MAEGVYYTLRLSFTVEVNQLLPSRRVFQQDVASRAGAEGVGGICSHASIGGFSMPICVDTRRLKLFLLYLYLVKSFEVYPMGNTLGDWAPTKEETASKESDKNFNMMKDIWKVQESVNASAADQ